MQLIPIAVKVEKSRGWEYFQASLSQERPDFRRESLAEQVQPFEVILWLSTWAQDVKDRKRYWIMLDLMVSEGTFYQLCEIVVLFIAII